MGVAALGPTFKQRSLVCFSVSLFAQFATCFPAHFPNLSSSLFSRLVFFLFCFFFFGGGGFVLPSNRAPVTRNRVLKKNMSSSNCHHRFPQALNHPLECASFALSTRHASQPSCHFYVLPRRPTTRSMPGFASFGSGYGSGFASFASQSEDVAAAPAAPPGPCIGS